MALIVETGAVVANANTFIGLADFQAWCDLRGYDYSPFTDDAQEAALVKMADYLNDLSWSGVKTGRDNSMAWPRYGDESGGNIWNQLAWPASEWVGVLDRDGFYIDTSTVPQEVIRAQCEGAWLILNGYNMEPALDRGGMIKRKKVDVIETEYFEGAIPDTEFKSIVNRLKGLLRGKNTMDLVRA